MLKFELSEQMVMVIGKALGAQPYDLVATVIAELQKQINAQQPKGNGQIVMPNASSDDRLSTQRVPE